MASLAGIADLPLHSGKAPGWLFPRMKRLGGSLAGLLISEFGQKEALMRLSDPFWFQALACLLGFDWHSSGTTTVTLAALKEGMAESHLPVHIFGGKGKAATGIQEELTGHADPYVRDNSEWLARISRTAARVDTLALQDGFDLYHHSLLFDERGNWAVIQQGLNGVTRYARRYHWNSATAADMLQEPHDAILGREAGPTLDLTSGVSAETRKSMIEMLNSRKAEWIERVILSKGRSQAVIDDFTASGVKMIRLEWGSDWNRLRKNFNMLLSECPQSFGELVMMPGIGRKTVMAIAMAAALVYGTEPSWKDPVKYSFAVGGKDGIPYPVDTGRMEVMSEIIETAVRESEAGNDFRRNVLRRLSDFLSPLI